MKRILFFIALIIFVGSCKKENQKKTQTTIKEVDSVKVVDLESTRVTDSLPDIDYASFGIRNVDIPKGLEVGSAAPEVSLIARGGLRNTLSDLYKEQPLVLIFYRGYWCPVCNKYLSDFAAKVSQIEAKGAKVIAITPETYNNIDKTKGNTNLSIKVYSDSDNSVMKAFDVDFRVTDAYQNIIQEKLNTSIKETNGAEEAVLPVPATFIINREGKIVYKQFDPDYHNRASVEDILKHL